MNFPENDYQILKLTDAFYKVYPNPPYTKILKKIKKEALKFVEDYISHILGIKVMHSREFHRRYAYSPLEYFHEALKTPVHRQF